MRKILILGKSGRIDCIADALWRSQHSKRLYAISEVHNPGLRTKTDEMEVHRTEDVPYIRNYARKVMPDFAIIGPEEPLAAGVVDVLTDELGVPCIGPRKSLARIETSKSFTRELLSKYRVPGSPEYRIFHNLNGLEDYLREERQGAFVIKPDGLTGGKGVKVSGEHLHSVGEAIEYCRQIFEQHAAVVIEEKLEGEEFSLQSFCDGRHIVDTLVVQDHKRAFNDDLGPNTGGMGSYTCEDHTLPFLSPEHVQEASRINASVAHALREELSSEYKGVLYGGFMLTRNGVRVLEYNARFGDPEIMNTLPLLQTDFIDVCEAIAGGTLDNISVVFDKKATVCKYVVPEGYPLNPVKCVPIEGIPLNEEKLRVFFGAVDQRNHQFYLTGSRAIAFLGIGDNVAEAERIAENAASKVKGPVTHRTDIGTTELITKRVEHMKKIMLGKDMAA